MDFFLAIGVAQGLLLTTILVLKKENVLANRLLASLVAIITFSLLLNFCYITGLIFKIPHLIGLDNANPFLIPPIILLYTKALTNKRNTIRTSDIAHFIPFAFYFLYLVVFFIVKDSTYKIKFLDGIHNDGLPIDLFVSSILKIIQGLVYMYLSYRILNIHSQSYMDNFSTKHKTTLNWLRTIVLCMIIIYVIRLIGIILPLVFSQLKPGVLESIMELVNVAFIYIMAYCGMQQPDIFKHWDIIKPERSVEPARIKTDKPYGKQDKPDANDSKSEAQLKKLLEYTAKEKPYLKHNLTIKELADSIGVHPKSLSKTINDQLQKNFYNFINEYRVEEVKQRLAAKEYEHLTILGIAYDSGFNSKSTFNTIFKKFTGITPSSYKSRLSDTRTSE